MRRGPRERRRTAPRRSPEEQSLARLMRHRYGELVEEIADHSTFATRAMFGCVGCYLHGRLTLVLADGARAWDGILVPTAREHHGALRGTIASLRPHAVLGKWLFLPAGAESFEDDARRLAELARVDDPRLGVEPTPRRRREGGGASRHRTRRRR